MYTIIWSRKAEIALFKVLEFVIQHQSNAYAIKITKEIKRTEKLLLNNLFIGTLSEIPHVRRCVILNHFSLFYRIDKDKKSCYIVYFWDNRQDPDTLDI